MRKNLRKAYKFYIYYNTMNSKQRTLLLIPGVTACVSGIAFLVSAVFKELYLVSVLSIILMVIGLILIALAFGD